MWQATIAELETGRALIVVAETRRAGQRLLAAPACP
jgi:hypothetical protein